MTEVRGGEAEATADAEAHRDLVRAEGHVPVEQGGQVPAAAERSHLVRIHIGELPVPTEADQETSLHEMTDRRRGHPRPNGSVPHGPP
ncbi:hypothetical protein [Streptomyces sp. NPDC002209]|uniref:hypothetical protein n=1 Tax=Streptomyces sp. NPDC002209 TaxID=3364638 RepID=UPI0036A9EBC1